MARKVGLIIGGTLVAVGLGLVASKVLGKGGGGGEGNGTKADFIYSSSLIIEPYGGPNDIRWEIEVTNVGTEAGTCHLEVYDRLRSSTGRWADFYLKSEQEATLQPGESHNFTGAHGRSGYTYQLMVKSEAGTIMDPDQPLEFICDCCWAINKTISSFATEEELAEHVATDHSEYLPMNPCTHFYLRGSFDASIAYWRGKAFFGRTRENILEGGGDTWPVGDEDYVEPQDKLEFVTPDGWETSRRGPCGNVPNSSFFDIYIGTVDGEWYNPLDTSPWVSRIPDGGTVTFDASERGCYNWKVNGVPV